ncbi:hypothetical protein FACS1894166_04320 [Bacilli bacterium]|nr:hypothetical protein FACS1894166_04320 [Bacilli bacterium]
MEIYSAKVSQINSYLKAIKYTHPTTLVDATGGYSGQPTRMLLSVCMVIELPKLISYVRTIDQKCLISSSYIADIDGEMAMQRQTY